MRSLLEPMERLLEEPFGPAASAWSELPEVEMRETPTELVVSARLEGLRREDLKVDVTESTLILQGSRSRSEKGRRHGILQRAESRQAFVRRMALPAPVKTEEVKATFRGGALEIRLPLLRERRAQRVTID
ncbi:MAG: Hsp20/alpha crystallin family protein [Elusimicrobia bacterium]|nr:Hsp20/alpha crystallin family protein [Elusimicrobiota bacterium]